MTTITNNTNNIEAPKYFSGSTKYTGVYKAHHKNLNNCLSQLRNGLNLELRVSRSREFYTIEKVKGINIKNLIRRIRIFIKEGFVFESTSQKNLKNLTRAVLKDFPIHAMYLLQNDVACGTTSLHEVLKELQRNRAEEVLGAIVPDEETKLSNHIDKLQEVCLQLSTDKTQGDRVFKPYDQKTVQDALNNIYNNVELTLEKRMKALTALSDSDRLGYQEECKTLKSINCLQNKFEQDFESVAASSQAPENPSALIEKALIIREMVEKLAQSRESCELLEKIDLFIGRMWDIHLTPPSSTEVITAPAAEQVTTSSKSKASKSITQVITGIKHGTPPRIDSIDPNPTFNAEAYKKLFNTKSTVEQLAQELAKCVNEIDPEANADRLAVILQKLNILKEVCGNKKGFKKIREDIIKTQGSVTIKKINI